MTLRHCTSKRRIIPTSVMQEGFKDTPSADPLLFNDVMVQPSRNPELIVTRADGRDSR